jgi:hypothetical protein
LCQKLVYIYNVIFKFDGNSKPKPDDPENEEHDIDDICIQIEDIPVDVVDVACPLTNVEVHVNILAKKEHDDTVTVNQAIKTLEEAHLDPVETFSDGPGGNVDLLPLYGKVHGNQEPGYTAVVVDCIQEHRAGNPEGRSTKRNVRLNKNPPNISVLVAQWSRSSTFTSPAAAIRHPSPTDW